MYYCHTRYYVPEWCRWLNADHPSFLQPDSLQGLNLYTYCGNNPIRRVDSKGTYWNSFWNDVENFFYKVGVWIKKNVGFEIITNSEQKITESYNPLYNTERGFGHSKEFSTNKPINFYISIPSEFWKIWEFSLGVDVNYNGYGFGYATGTEVSFTTHIADNSFSVYRNLIGRIGLKQTTKTIEGMYAYEKFELHGTTIAIAILCIIFAPEITPLLIPAVC